MTRTNQGGSITPVKGRSSNVGQVGAWKTSQTYEIGDKLEYKGEVVEIIDHA